MVVKLGWPDCVCVLEQDDVKKDERCYVTYRIQTPSWRVFAALVCALVVAQDVVLLEIGLHKFCGDGDGPILDALETEEGLVKQPGVSLLHLLRWPPRRRIQLRGL
jgi:hypothetical protein